MSRLWLTENSFCQHPLQLSRWLHTKYLQEIAWDVQIYIGNLFCQPPRGRSQLTETKNLFYWKWFSCAELVISCNLSPKLNYWVDSNQLRGRRSEGMSFLYRSGHFMQFQTKKFLVNGPPPHGIVVGKRCFLSRCLLQLFKLSV